MEQLALVTKTPTENDLLSECRKGDREAMHFLFVENHRRVYSIALNFFGGKQEQAEDITQQVFLKIFTKMTFRGDSEFTTWLYRLTVNACIDETRKNRRLFGIADWFGTRDPEAKVSLNDIVQSHEISAEVQAAIHAMKPDFRVPIILKYVEGLSYQEIADVLECSIGTVSSRLNRGHKMLAAKLGHLRGEI